MAKELILAINDHRKFGTLISAYVINPSEGNTFYTSIEKANNINVKEIDEFTNTKATIVKLISEYDDSYIANLFTRKKEEARDFIKKVNHEFIELRIKPHIERRLHQIIKLLPTAQLRIFYKDRSYATIYLADEIFHAGTNAKAVFNFNRNEEGIQYFLSIHHGGEVIILKNKKVQILTDSPCNLVLNQKLYTFHDVDSKKLLPFFEKQFISIPKQTELEYFEKFVLNTIMHFKVIAQGFVINELSPTPKRQLYLQNDMQGKPTLLLKFQYGNKILLPNNLDKIFVTMEVKDDEYIFTKTIRNIDFEKAAKEQLKPIGLDSPDGIHFYPKVLKNELAGDELFSMVNWLNQNVEKIKELSVECKQTFFTHKYLLSPIIIELSVSDTNDWFDVKGSVKLGGFTFPFIRLRRNILKHIREYELPDGTIAILPLEWFARYKELFLLSEHSEAGLKLKKIHFNLLSSQQIGIKGSQGQKIKNLLSEGYKLETDVPDGLQATLRPYQVEGFSWMRQLKHHNFGGCLADDMGLGKTLQTLSLLLESSTKQVVASYLVNEKPITQLSLFDAPITTAAPQMKAPTSLIVMPASLIYNWYNEAAKFTPQLKVFKHVGNNRIKDLAAFSKYDLILTTYGVIRNDVDELKKFPFHYAILDESQVIKNPDSKNYQSVIQLKASHKLVLTGTPIENSLTDLWSQMNFLNHGLLGSYSFFKNEFVTPIEKQNDEAKSEKLQALIHPFILRRTKDQVAKDLPARTEQILYCEMGEVQRKIYEEEKSAIRNAIFESLEKKGVQNSAIMVLQAITRLRQLANHPKLLKIEEESGKFEEVTRMLQNVVAEKHKVLIFSSFVGHLNLYKAYLDENNLKYSLLTGQTKNRQDVIEEFQNDSDIQVFLISLKAGGVGLNLTAADYVFLLDPWWNPAAENQAINRAHRIGQDKKVFVYRFISSESIEEKIVQLQSRKTELADLFINTNNPFKTLSAERIRELFS